jgi:chlorobactene glucosyltransferase
LVEVNDPSSPVALASGPFIMVTRNAYEDVGTWKALRTEITEDIALAAAVKAHGRTLMAATGNDLVRTREFASVGEVCQFWRRTYYGAFGKKPRKLLRLTASFTSLTILFLLMSLSAILYVTGNGALPSNILFILSAAAMLAVIVPFGVFLHHQEGNVAYALTAPLGIAVSLWVALSTFVAVLGDKGIQWRGSLYR